MRKKPLTKKQREKIHEELEKIDLMGQESETKALPYILDAAKEKEKIEKDREELRLEGLEKNKKQTISYREIIIRYLHEMIYEIGIPPKWQWGVWFDGIGVRVSVVTPGDKMFARAFKLTHSPKYDLHACYKFTRWVEDVLDAFEEESSVGILKPKIWTPPKVN